MSFPEKYLLIFPCLCFRYTSTLTKFFYWRFLLQPISSTITIAAAIFLQHTDNWSSGYGYAACSYIQLLVLCYMGNLVQIQVRLEIMNLAYLIMSFNFQKHRLVASVYSFKWYLMINENQKMILSVLHRIQHISALSIGPFADLHFETAADVSPN